MGPTTSADLPAATDTPRIAFDHLLRLSGPHGLFEHAEHDRPRASHGYTTDDNARALVIASRTEGFPPALLEKCRAFVLSSETSGGVRNRMSAQGKWLDRVGSADAWGRAVWGLGALTTPSTSELDMLSRLLGRDSHHPRALAYGMLGAVQAIGTVPEAEPAVVRWVQALPRPREGSWPWPWDRLTYDNARIPEALIVGGRALGDERAARDGIGLLAWLVEVERGENGFSFTPTTGRGPESSRPGFDQQPIEAWGIADAASAALRSHGDPMWRDTVAGAWEWFMGRNDLGAQIYDESSGAGYDGLGPTGVNLNRGAESTLAALGTAAAYTTMAEGGMR